MQNYNKLRIIEKIVCLPSGLLHVNAIKIFRKYRQLKTDDLNVYKNCVESMDEMSNYFDICGRQSEHIQMTF